MNIKLIEEETKNSIDLSLTKNLCFSKNSIIVYADRKYSIQMERFDNRVEIFLSDKKIGSFDKDSFVFLDNIFSESVGFSFLRFLFYIDNKKVEVFSPYINVCVEEKNAKPLKHMVNYIFDNSDLLLHSNVPDLELENFLSVNLNKQFYQKISLINEIVNRYKKHYLYFKNNRKCKLENKENISSISRLTTVDSSTLTYIVQHIENLDEVKTSKIKIDNHYYLPNKVLMKENQKTAIIYENKVLVNFLFSVLINFENIQTEIDTYWNILKSEKIEEHYVSPTKLLEDVFEKEIIKLKTILGNLKRELLLVFNMYLNLFPINTEPLYYCPLPTNTFIEIKEYRSIYELIKYWFETGMLKVEQQDLFSPLLIDNKIYEFYVLTKMCNYFCKYCNFDLYKKENFHYNEKVSTYFENNICNNTFVFYDNFKKITLYYEPMICVKGHYKKKYSNEIDLVRNNKISINSVRGNYYLPDFVLKIESANGTKYIVLDAKYSTEQTIKNYQLVDLVFKYLFSFTCLNDTELLGLGIICGKNEDLKLETIFDEELVNIDKPFVDFLCFPPAIEEKEFENKQFLKLDEFFDKNV